MRPVGVRVIEAEPELARWLDFVAARTRSRRWLVKGVWYERERDDEARGGCAWVRRLHEPDAPRTGRTPDYVMDASVVAGYEKVRLAEEEAETSMADALRGEVQRPVRDLDGVERIEYPSIRLKNADGTLTRAAKNLIEVHGKRGRIEAEANAHLHTAFEKVDMVDAQGRVLPVPVRMADRIAKQRGLKPLRRRARAKERLYARTDGTKVELVRKGGAVIEREASA